MEVYILLLVLLFIVALLLWSSIKQYFGGYETVRGGWLPEGVEKEVPVETPFGIALLYLYKVGYHAKMHGNEVMSYHLRRQEGGSLVGATENTVFVSDIPSLRGYTFEVIPGKPSPRGNVMYTVIRLS